MEAQQTENTTYLRKVKRKLRRGAYDLLKVDFIRFWFCYARWAFWKTKLKVSDTHGQAVSPSVIDYNLTAFSQPRAAFGMGKRMALLLFPTVALLRDTLSPRVLIVGPRTEDDILWARSLGLINTRGLDLFSYSRLIDIGDMHQMTYGAGSFDAVLFAWVLAYSRDPAKAVTEGKRLLKAGGLLGIGMESMHPDAFETAKATRYNLLNYAEDLVQLVDEKVIFLHDPPVAGLEQSREIGVIFRLAQ